MLCSVCVLLVWYIEDPKTLLSKVSFYTGTAASTVEPVTGLAGIPSLPAPLQYGLSLGLLSPHPTSWKGWRASADYWEGIHTLSSTLLPTGGWGPWSPWSPCSHSCTDPAHPAWRSRTRLCLANCTVGDSSQERPCNLPSCTGMTLITAFKQLIQTHT